MDIPERGRAEGICLKMSLQNTIIMPVITRRSTAEKIPLARICEKDPQRSAG